MLPYARPGTIVQYEVSSSLAAGTLQIQRVRSIALAELRATLRKPDIVACISLSGGALVGDAYHCNLLAVGSSCADMIFIFLQRSHVLHKKSEIVLLQSLVLEKEVLVACALIPLLLLYCSHCLGFIAVCCYYVSF